MNKILTLVCLVLILSDITIQPANAYLDPGTGSVIVQSLIASIAAVGLVVKGFWTQITRFFTGKKVKQDEDIDD